MAVYTVDIFIENQADPGVWTQITDDFNGAIGMFGYQPDDPGTYRFRVDMFEDGAPFESAFTDWTTFGRSRVMTEELKALLGGRQRRDRIWLFVEDADGTQQDRSSFLTGFRVSYSIDARVGNATVRIRREHGAGTLAPLVETSPLNLKLDGSYGPAIEKGRHFSIWVAPVAWNATPALADAFPIFCGRIDGHDFSSSDATFYGRDIHGRIADTFIEIVRQYGAPEPGQPIQEMIQQILSDNTKEDALYVPEDIDAEGGLIWIEKAFLLETVRNIALEAGADLRGKWRDSNGAFALTLDEPDIAATEPEYVFGKDEWFAVDKLSNDIADIRNRAAGSFVDENGQRWFVGIPVPANDPSAGLLIEDSAFPGAGDAGLLADAESEGNYGPRYSELNLDDTSPVRTLAAFERLQDAYVGALSESDVDLSISTFLFPFAGLNRLYGFAADGIRWTEQQNYACIAYDHNYEAPRGNMDATFETIFTCRGRARAAKEEYLVKERPPRTRTTAVIPPPDPTGEFIAIANAVNGPGAQYWEAPAEITVSWSTINPDPFHRISIDRSLDGGPWDQIAVFLPINSGFYNDSIPGYQNRPPFQSPPITHTVQYRVRITDISDVTLNSRITVAVPLGPP